MNKKIIIVEGYPASGKSTFTRELSKAIGVPYLMKDTFKIALCKNISVTSLEESRLYSSVTFDAMMYVVERLMETGSSMIIEGNFVPAGIKKTDESQVIKTLISEYNYQSLVFKFTGDTQILHKRYIERDKLPERGGVNAFYKSVSYTDFAQGCRNLDSFYIGENTMVVDTTDFDVVDFNSHIEKARSFIKEKA